MVRYSSRAARTDEAEGRVVGAPATEFALLAERSRPATLANEELIPVAPVLFSLLGQAGLRRGSTTVLERAGGPGVTSLALGLIAEATTAGMWCAAVGLPSLGLVAASELGVALDHLVLVPDPRERQWQVCAALLDGCDVVLTGASRRPSLSEARRLGARARERRTALVVVEDQASRRGGAHRWEGPDLTLSTTGGRFLGLGEGSGRIGAHLVEVHAERRRGSPREVRASLWLPPMDAAGWQEAAPTEAAPAEQGDEPPGEDVRATSR